MKFDNKYPDAYYPFERGKVALGKLMGNCIICHIKTYWYSIDLGAFVCSDECHTILRRKEDG